MSDHLPSTLELKSGHHPFTIILMLPEDVRSDEDYAADWVRREWVWGDGSTEAGLSDMVETARARLAEVFEWSDMYDDDELRGRLDSLEPVAVYPGHIFDIYQP